tara:strand:+ start:193 stop:1023 length:831 start_codon:yes stop_codon:yes gene_type:complete
MGEPDLRKSTFEIVSWNVNGLRAAVRKGFLDWLLNCKADLVGVQEVRVNEDQLGDLLAGTGDWYFNLCSAERKGYSGVALFSRNKPDSLETHLKAEFDREGRLQFAQFGNLKVVNGYFPNGSGRLRDNSRVPYKLRFYRKLFKELKDEFDDGRPIIVMGDFNTAHAEIDLARPKQNQKASGFLPEERRELGRWIKTGWIDSFREFKKETGHYSWWSQQKGVRERNVGWRIDYILCSPGAKKYLQDATIHPSVMGSDHCPISVSLDRKVLGKSSYGR